MDGPRRSLIVKLPMPESMDSQQRNSVPESRAAPAAPAAPNLPSYDRAFWTSLTNNSGLLRIGTMIQALGLKRTNRQGDTNRGVPTFDHPPVRQLASAIVDTAASLPKNAEELVDAATDVMSLEADIAGLLHRFGAKIWGRDSERTWLLEASNDVENYEKNLVFEEAVDQLVLKHYLRMWILLKAFNTLRNEGQRNAKKKSNAGDSQQPAAAQKKEERQLPPASGRDPSTFTSKGASEASTTPLAITSTPLSLTRLPDSHISDQSPPPHPYIYTTTGPEVATVTSNGTAINGTSINPPISTTSPVQEGDLGKLRGPHGIALPETRDDMSTLTVRGLIKPRRAMARGKGNASSERYPDDAQNATQGIRATSESRKDPSVKPIAATLGKASTSSATEPQSQSLQGSMRMLGSSSSRDSFTPASSTVTVVQNISPLPFNEYWDERTWRRFTKTSPVPFHTFTSCLGLVKCQVNRGTTFNHPVAKSMSAEINQIATSLYAKHSTESLVACAADPDFLDEEIDVLLDEYAPDIWGMDADRSKLLKPGVDSAYPKDLVYENDDDRKLLWLYLHRWIFAKAFSLLREWGSSDEVKQGVVAALSHGSSSRATSLVPERSNAPTPSAAEDAHEHKGKRKASIPPNYEQPKRPKGDEIQVSPYEKLPATQPNASSLTTTFLKYLQNGGQSSALEATSLDSIEHEFSQVATYLPKLLKYQPYAANFPGVFASWIDYRRTILAVSNQVTALPTEQLSAVQMKIKRARLVTELRKARDEFQATGDAEMSANYIISMCFGGLQRTSVEGERIMGAIREGFRVLDERLVELGELLGGGEWIVMG